MNPLHKTVSKSSSEAAKMFLLQIFEFSSGASYFAMGRSQISKQLSANSRSVTLHSTDIFN
jgi:hypothetical protein